MNPLCSIFFHNYYGSHQSWIDYFKENISFPVNLYYNIVEDSLYNIESPEKDFYTQLGSGAEKNLRKIIVRQSPNMGKDIGGKLVLLDAYQKLELPTEYGLFLHDKRSPYKANNKTWMDNLFRIAETSFSEKALKIFANNHNIGIITANGNVRDEYDYNTKSFKTNNRSLLPELQNRFNIKPSSFQYAAGTMFWFRMEPITRFFMKYEPLQIRTMLEKGNVTDEKTGTYTHSWERLLCWIVTNENYTIKTI